METRTASPLPLLRVARLITSGTLAGTVVEVETTVAQVVGQVVNPWAYGPGYIVTAVEQIDG